MKRLKFFNEDGAVVTVAMGMLVIFISLISNTALLDIIATDTQQTQFEHDAIQEELLLRSEAQRVTLKINSDPNNTLIPDNTIQIEEPDRMTTYQIDNKVSSTGRSQKSQKSRISAHRGRMYGSLTVSSPVVRLTERQMHNNSLSKYQYFTDKEESENSDLSPSGFDKVSFWGPDVLYGPVHSNSNIVIQQGGGGPNNGWPSFYDDVTTAGVFLDNSLGAFSHSHWQDVFLNWGTNGTGQANVEENAETSDVAEIVLPTEATEIRQNGTWLGTGNINLVYAKLTGNSSMVKQASISEARLETFNVYDVYPDSLRNGAVYWTGFPLMYLTGSSAHPDTVTIANVVPIKDTTWTTISGPMLNDRSAFVDCELWIEGSVSSYQTWGASGNIYLTDDLYYENTARGESPTPDKNTPEEWNPTDMLGVVSEKSIYIKYGNIDPWDRTNDHMGNTVYRRKKANCKDIYLYGAYAALGKGDPDVYGVHATHYDGLFTFEYQHPHGSTPNCILTSPYTGRDTLMTYIDLHKFWFPEWCAGYSTIPANFARWKFHGNAPLSALQPAGYPYEDTAYNQVTTIQNVCHPEYSNPDNIIYYRGGNGPYGEDYPWYNPIWPENLVFGSAQSPPDGNIANNFERGTIYIWGSIAQRRRGFVHRSGTDPLNHTTATLWDLANYKYDGTHPKTGYAKSYQYDWRFTDEQPPDYPQVYKNQSEMSAYKDFATSNWVFKTPRNW